MNVKYLFFHSLLPPSDLQIQTSPFINHQLPAIPDPLNLPTQQQISRLESPSYEGHSLSMLRRVAEVLGAKVYVKIQRNKPTRKAAVAENKARYGNRT